MPRESQAGNRESFDIFLYFARALARLRDRKRENDAIPDCHSLTHSVLALALEVGATSFRHVRKYRNHTFQSD